MDRWSADSRRCCCVVCAAPSAGLWVGCVRCRCCCLLCWFRLLCIADVRRDRERVPHRKPRSAAASSAHPTALSSSSASAAAAAASSSDAHPYSQPQSAGSASPDIPRTSAQDIAATAAQSGNAPPPAATAGPGAGGGGGGAADGSELYGSSYTNRRTREADLLHDIVRQTRSNFIDVATSTSAAAAAAASSSSSSAAGPALRVLGGAANPGGRYGSGERLTEEREERSRTYTANLDKHTAAASGATAAAADRLDRDGKKDTTHLSSSLLTSSLLAAPLVAVSVLSLPLPLSLPSHTTSTAVSDLLSTASLRAADRRWLLTRAQLVSETVADLHVTSSGKLVLAFDELQLPA